MFAHKWAVINNTAHTCSASLIAIDNINMVCERVSVSESQVSLVRYDIDAVKTCFYLSGCYLDEWM